MRRLLVAGPVVPHPSHSVRAANVVLYELLQALVRTGAFEILFLEVRGSAEPQPTSEEAQGLRRLHDAGVTILDPLQLPPPVARSRRERLRALASVERFYPDAMHRSLFNARVEAARADVVLVPWSESVTALAAHAPATLFAYYGNPDHVPLEKRALFERRHGNLSLLQYLRRMAEAKVLQRIHLREIRRFDYLGSVSANFAPYYTDRGHPNAFYIRNTWITRGNVPTRRTSDSDVLTIVGNVGKLDATGNTFGLFLLGAHFVPALRTRLEGRPFRIKVLGARQPHPAVAQALDQPEIELCGFVRDIDREIADADIFLCLNNAGAFKAGHTRYLHAWSLGACVVAHADAALSMPEMRHDDNCLLGADIAGTADQVARAATDAALRERVGQAGFQTFREDFSPDVVAHDIVAHLSSR